MADEIKTCAYCGASGTVNETFPMFDDPWHVTFDHAADCPLRGWEGYCYPTEEGAIAAWNTRAPLGAVPGFVVVPEVPTEEMVEAGAEAWTPGIAGDGIRTSWSAMLAASPIRSQDTSSGEME